jgi:hypothetical protein
MNNIIVTRISNGLGNQLFQYAAAYALAKKLKRKLLIDNESAYFKKKDSLRNYELHNFNLSTQIVDQKYKFNNYLLDTKRKFLKKIDFLLTKKKFIIESKNQNKKTSYYNIKICNPHDILFMEGYYESFRYFEETELNIQNEFNFKNEELYSSNKYLEIINNNSVVAITIRQNRYSEQKMKPNDIVEGKIKSDNFMQNTINYINRAVNFFDKKINNPKYLIWSNDFCNLRQHFNDSKFYFVLNENNKILNDFYLLTKCKYFIVGPTSFGWWGAWLSKFKDKIILRPADNILNPSNNFDFWPEKWISI